MHMKDPEQPKKEISQKQLEANRLNAILFSTGPTSEAGKATSRLNATRHNLTGEFILLSWENPAEYAMFEKMSLYELAPRGILERKLALRIVQGLWRMDRVSKFEYQAIAGANCREVLEAELNRYALYEGRIWRNTRQAMRDLELLQQKRLDRKRRIVPNEKIKAIAHALSRQGPPPLPEALPYDAYEGRKHMEHRLDVARAAYDYKCQACSKVIPPDEIREIKGNTSPADSQAADRLPNGLTKAEREQWRKGLRASRWGVPSKRQIPRAVSVLLKSMQDYVTVRDQLGFPVSYPKTGPRELSPAELKARNAARPQPSAPANEPQMGSFFQNPSGQAGANPDSGPSTPATGDDPGGSGPE